MPATLIGVPGSHPSLAAELMLRHKGVPYTRYDLPNISHRAILPLLRYRSTTVPVMRIDGRRVIGTRRIARALDAVRPTPPLVAGAAMERAEAWADDSLQDTVRRLTRWAVVHDPPAMAGFLAGARPPVSALAPVLPVVRPVVALQMRVPDAAAQACAQALPAALDRVDALLAEGVIGGEQVNAADFQVATSVRLAMCFDQLRERIAARPAGAHALRVCPDFPGRVRAVVPGEWLA
ncbi:MAG TPA: glutathione S-transferase N-terminal domain-containing protein [Thermoleophilaceae bacterium]